MEPIIIAQDAISPALAVELLPFGFTLNKILVNPDGKTHDIVIGPFDPQEHASTRSFQNCIVGRYSNRVPVQETPVEKHGIKATVSPVSSEGPTVSLHGGPSGFDRATFTEVPSPILFSAKELETIAASFDSHAIYGHTSPADDQGYPGELYIEVLVGLTPPPKNQIIKSLDQELKIGSIFIIYRAKLNSGGSVTAINLTQHWGFNLDASLAKTGEATPDVKNHKLTIKADRTIELDSVALATGTLLPSEGTHHEHDKKLIGEGFPEKGYDEFYIFTPPSKPPTAIYHPLSVLSDQDLIKDLIPPKDAKLPAPVEEPLVELSSAASGLFLRFHSNQSGVQFYSGNLMTGAGTRKQIHGGSASGTGYTPGAAAFLEFHEPLASYIHTYGAPSIAPEKSTLLTSDELYHNYVRLDISYCRPQDLE